MRPCWSADPLDTLVTATARFVTREYTVLSTLPLRSFLQTEAHLAALVESLGARPVGYSASL